MYIFKYSFSKQIWMNKESTWRNWELSDGRGTSPWHQSRTGAKNRVAFWLLWVGLDDRSDILQFISRGFVFLGVFFGECWKTLSTQEVVLGCSMWGLMRFTVKGKFTLVYFFWSKGIMPDQKLLGSSNFICVPLSTPMCMFGWSCCFFAGSRRSFRVFNSAVDATS